MLRKLKIWHFLVLVWIAVLLARFEFILNFYNYFFNLFSLLIFSRHNVINFFDFNFFDFLFSAVSITLIPLVFILLRHKAGFLFMPLKGTHIVIIVLFVSFLLAPILADENPDFQKNIGMTKLLPPLSGVKVLHLKLDQSNKKTEIDEFIELRNKIIKQPFDDKILFVDSILINKSEAIYYQQGIPEKISVADIITVSGRPMLTSKLFILGSDEFGRDIFARLVYGARISLFVGFLSVIISLLIGLLLGFLAGYIGGLIDVILSRLTDMFLAFPTIFLVILILALFGNNLMSVIIVLGFSGWMSLYKIVKGEVVSIKIKDFFITSQMLGLTKTQLLFREVLPLILAPVIVNVVFLYGNVILAESALSYLGLGTGEVYPSWGSMISSGQEYLSQAWWMILFPGLILILTLLTANKLGVELNRHYNPRLHG